MTRYYSNTAVETYITTGINASVTTLTVNSASGYPIAPFTIRCESEIILVGVKTGNVFSSCTRGFDNTTAVSHLVGSVVEHRAIANDFEFRRIDPVNDKTNLNAFSDHFDDNDLDAAWTQTTPTGTVTWTEGADVLSGKFTSQSANDCVGMTKSLGVLSYPIVITTGIRMLAVPNYSYAGLLFSDGTSSTSNVIWGISFLDAAYGFNHTWRTGTFTNISSTIITERRPILVGGWIYQRMIWRATNTWSFEISSDGVSWTDYDNGNENFALTPTHFGFGVSTWGGTLSQIASFEFFNVTDVLP